MSLTSPGCGRATAPASPASFDALQTALRPAALASSLRRLPGAHFRATASFRVTAKDAAPRPGDPAAAPDAITTTTELWLDRRGQFRLVETNDQGGGREVLLFDAGAETGRQLAVALRPGKMMRRSAQEPEPTNLLEEAVGAPWAAWDTVRRFVAVEDAGGGRRRLVRGPTPRPPDGDGTATALRRWRDTVAVSALQGEARFDPSSGAVIGFVLEARFSAHRDRQPLDGELAVTAAIDEIGRTAEIAAPDADPLRVLQRTVLDERALLGGGP